MSETKTDQQLVELVQQGNKAAFDLLVRKYQHKVLNLVSRFVKNQGDVPDVAQEAFIKAYRALPNFRGDSAFYTWLYRIAVNTAKNYLVAQKRRPSSSDIDIEDGEYYDGGEELREGASPERLLLTDELQGVVVATLEKLPEDLRTAITLRELDGLSYEDIANVMECPVGTVRSRIFRAREALDKQIDPLMQR
ncbi:RNA polymerase sigma factor RpoE [Psychrobium sp. MM17-31]|jgi:RNA polymerase sigma-70 factor (ECF subfamily)|uniref:RNA polymerase sigma factor RpoE n=1 Tax=Psychrobium sp. MM17-31 TaxID=2917758 RepID=UPI001EF44947|nr:RNA polymerase sigma factor RpoE [Psychrobium sp. MM17-31]MCG7530957.1 RNA polymerase sigma factor RpoE [Psychrobium sp. MM17-31]